MTHIEFNTQLIGLQTSLMIFARSLTANIEEAHDLTQETFYKALTNKDKFNPTTNMKAWTFIIMKNTFINNYRKSKRSGQFYDTTEDSYFLNKGASKDNNPQTLINTKDIKKVVNGLDDEHRVPFKMYFDGFKYKEIADKLDLSIGTVKSRIFFGRKKMMNQLASFAS